MLSTQLYIVFVHKRKTGRGAVGLELTNCASTRWDVSAFPAMSSSTTVRDKREYSEHTCLIKKLPDASLVFGGHRDAGLDIEKDGNNDIFVSCA